MDQSMIVPVILCGGSGTRLWPASREEHPKQFLKLTGKNSLLQETVQRAAKTANVPMEHLVVVTVKSQQEKVKEQLAELDPSAQSTVLCEPCPRNTAAAIAFAAKYVVREFGKDALLWILPADHHIDDEQALSQAYALGLQAAQQGYLVTFGIQPTRPETGYGYILQGGPLIENAVYKIQEFVEKPDPDTARAYLEAGDYLWNSGMFLFRADTALSQFGQHAPEILTGVAAAVTDEDYTQASPDLYAALPSEPFDKAIMEKSAQSAVVPCDPRWSDIGSWESLWEIKNKDENGNALEGHVACHNVKNSLIESKDRLIACAGIENIIVVDTGDAILIADRRDGDSIKALVNELKKSGAPEVLKNPER